MKNWFLFGFTVLLVTAMFTITLRPAHAQNADQVGYPQFVRLWNSQTIANLENENRINELCPSSLETGQEACVKEKLKGESWNLELLLRYTRGC